MIPLKITRDWGEISLLFQQMFGGLGTVYATEHLLEFRALSPTVPTGISIARSGVLVANMPLHAIESEFATVAFSSDLTSLTLAGEGGTYTYTVPPALLALRSA